ncbi:hypothetical protein GCM10019016_059550 [Streptomyces prasinosporus]|uniref:Uncharacterized protein n=1 Tax=Streptomyces prasinosporus TaxID=68256 RepID=A0ABP6TWL7_9ACTN
MDLTPSRTGTDAGARRRVAQRGRSRGGRGTDSATGPSRAARVSAGRVREGSSRPAGRRATDTAAEPRAAVCDASGASRRQAGRTTLWIEDSPS